MNQKIITVGSGEGQVLVYRDRDEDGDEIVCVRAWVNEDHLVERIVGLPDDTMALAYVKDYSDDTAEDFWEDAKAEYDANNK